MLSMSLLWSFGEGKKTCEFNSPLISFNFRGLTAARFASHLLSGKKFSYLMKISARENEYN